VVEHRLVDRGEAGVIDIEPVEVAVETEGGGRGFPCRELAQGLQRRQVAVEAANDVKGIRRLLRYVGQRGRPVAVAQGAGATRTWVEGSGWAGDGHRYWSSSASETYSRTKVGAGDTAIPRWAGLNTSCPCRRTASPVRPDLQGG
jgi:hypothetical protein